MDAANATESNRAEERLPDEAELTFATVFYHGLFHPVRLYQHLAQLGEPCNRLLFYGLMMILLVSASVPVVQVVWKGGELHGLGWSMPFQALAGFAVWLLMGGIISTLAHAFGGQARFKTFLTLSALSTVPWVLMGPLSLLKTGLEPVGSWVGVLGGLIIWLWSVFLFALAVGATYQLSLDRVLLILMLPFVFSGVALVWVTGFFVNIGHLMP